MKSLTCALSALLLFIPSLSLAQDKICEKLGGQRIVADFVCPLGYLEVGEVEASSSSGRSRSAGMQIYQDMINRNEADRQARLDRQAAAAEAQRQRDFLAQEAKKQREYEQRQRQLVSQQAKPPAEIVGKNLANAPIGTLIELTCGTDAIKNHKFIFKTDSKNVTVVSKNVGNSNMNMPRIARSEVVYENTQSAFIFRWELSGRSEYSGKSFSDYYEYKINKLSKLASVRNTTQLEGRKAFIFYDGEQECRLSNYAEPLPELDSDTRRGSALADSLKNLSDLYNQGILTEEEFNAAKRRLLGL